MRRSLLLAATVFIALLSAGCPTSLTSILEAPDDLSAFALSSTQVAVTWSDNSDAEDSFVIECCSDGSFTSQTEETVAADTESHTVAGLTPETTYFFRVRACNAQEQSEWSAIKSAQTDAIAVGSFCINSEAVYTNTTAVTLNSDFPEAVEMRFKNDGGEWGAWHGYAPTESWTLTAGDGTKTVHAEYRTALDEVVSASDAIELDTVAPSVVSFEINNDDEYTTSTDVTLVSAVSGVSEMRFSDEGEDWSDWCTFDAAHSWILPEGDGLAVVESQFRDAAGNLSSTVSDDIVLDTAGPVVNGFTVMGPSSDSETYTSDVTLHLDVTDAVSMRFSNVEDTDWAGWQPYSSTSPWTIREHENFVVSVYAEFEDEAGNISGAVSRIYYDAIRRLRISARRLEVLDDGDPTGPGEICWNFWTVFDAPSGARLARTISQRESPQAISMTDGEELVTGGNVRIEIARMPGSSYDVRFWIGDRDDPLLSVSETAELTWSFDDWGLSTSSQNGITALGDTDERPSGKMYFHVEKVD